MAAAKRGSEDGYLLPPEVCALLRVEPKTLINWRYRREGPAWLKVGGRIRYRVSVIDAYIADSERLAQAA